MGEGYDLLPTQSQCRLSDPRRQLLQNYIISHVVPFDLVNSRVVYPVDVLAVS